MSINGFLWCSLANGVTVSEWFNLKPRRAMLVRTRKWFAVILAAAMLMSLLPGFAAAEELMDGAINTVEDFEVEYLAAPAVAGLLLEEAGIDNRYGTGRTGGNYINDVAAEMGPGTDFHGIVKEDEFAYLLEIAAYLESKVLGFVNLFRGVLDPTSSFATATDNEDGTVTLSITVVDLYGDPICGLDPLSDFFVKDSVITGTFYFGTSSIPGSGSTEWAKVDGVYTVVLERNYFNARPAGYDDGWYRIWDIYILGEMVEDDLILKTTYWMVGDWALTWDIYARFVVVTTHEDGVITGFFGVGYDPEGNPTGTITGTVSGQNLYMYYDRTGYSTDGYYAELTGTIANDGNSASGTYIHGNNGIPRSTGGNWTMTRIVAP